MGWSSGRPFFCPGHLPIEQWCGFMHRSGSGILGRAHFAFAAHHGGERTGADLKGKA
jgi:hypothetical protein